MEHLGFVLFATTLIFVVVALSFVWDDWQKSFPWHCEYYEGTLIFVIPWFGFRLMIDGVDPCAWTYGHYRLEIFRRIPGTWRPQPGQVIFRDVFKHVLREGRAVRFY